MYYVKTMNNITAVGLMQLPGDKIRIDNNTETPSALLVRSANLHEMPFHPELLCIARAGAGVNNIPLERSTKNGVVVFNTPGANANAVKELVICALLLASRDIIGGVEWCKTLTGDVASQVEKGKSRFAGPEISGKTLGIIGVGAIGVGVANASHHLGMEVLGYDPYISVDAAWGLSRNVHRAHDIRQVFAESDYLTLHVPLNDDTKKTLAGMLSQVKPGVRIINLARGSLLDSAELKEALQNGTVARYITDFPDETLLDCPGVVPLPHLGASTPESEDNCAIMAAEELSDYLLHGNIKNSVNYPDAELPYAPGYRMCVFHKNVPHMLSEISKACAAAGLNIENMLSKSRGEVAYTMLDLVSLPGSAVVETLNDSPNIIRVRVIKV